VSGERERFLDQVRQAVAAGNRVGGAVPLPERAGVGHQGAGSDLLARFCTELSAAGGHPYVVADRAAVVTQLLALAQQHAVHRVLLGREPFLDSLELAEPLRRAGLEVIAVDQLTGADRRQEFFAADLGLSGVDYLVAETGSIALRTRPDQPRSLSLLPPVHVAIAHRGQLLPDLFDLFEGPLHPDRDSVPACLSLITGPSKTGDIELRLVTGVHGPGEVHVIIVDDRGLPKAGAGLQ
jgi:L-lactate utilization protein LutC